MSQLPPKPARSGREIAAIIDPDRLVPAILPAARDALALARYWYAVAMRYRREAITEAVKNERRPRRQVAIGMDAFVLDD